MTEVTYSAAAKAVVQAKAVIVQLRASRAQLEAERDGLHQRNEQIRDMPVSRPDAMQVMFDAVDARGRAFIGLARWDEVFKDFAYPNTEDYKRVLRTLHKQTVPALSLRDVDKAFEAGAESLASVFSSGPSKLFTGKPATGDQSTTAAYFFFGDLIKRKIAEHFESLFPDIDPSGEAEPTSLAERRAEIVANGERARAISGEIDTIDEQLRALDTSRGGALFEGRGDILDRARGVPEVRAALGEGVNAR